MDIQRFICSVPALASCLLRAPAWCKTLAPLPDSSCLVPHDFFGICVAPTDDPAGDDYILERLNDLGLRDVRIDFTQTSFGGSAERLLQRLLANAFDVCLHLVPHIDEASTISTEATQASWRAFVARTMDAFGGQAGHFEICSTVNRRKWAGLGPAGFMTAWSIAHSEAVKRGIKLAAPNVTDFEPIYNIMLLAGMRSKRILPDLHTNNLFVERATEPEAFDHKVFGKALAGLGKFNLVRKARLLQHIGAWAGVPILHSSHVSWSLRRIARILPDVEAKQADYLARYCLLAAASGALSRIYWGPLIGQREGLVDDGTDEFPDIPHVTFYGRTPGHLQDYRIRPAFRAYQTINRLLAKAVFKARLSSSHKLHIIEFETNSGECLHAAWTINGAAASTAACYDPAHLAAARCISRDGADIPIPPLITETPVYFLWPGRAKQTMRSGADVEPDFSCHTHGALKTVPFEKDGWRGFRSRMETAPDSPHDLIRTCLSISDDVLRDSRNTVWRAPAPWNSETKLVIKRFQPPRGFRRLLQAGKPNRARRSWNGAHELLRRGLHTPAPTAFLERTSNPAESECFYVCESFTGFSVRHAFSAFRDGENDFNGIPAQNIYAQIAEFTALMHQRGVFFRDLSAGNLLWRADKNNRMHFALIDTTRARFDTKPLGLRLRLSDLMRLCHPLHQAGRQTFLEHYFLQYSRPWRVWMHLPFVYYDTKHRIKGLLKRFRRSKNRT